MSQAPSHRPGGCLENKSHQGGHDIVDRFNGDDVDSSLHCQMRGWDGSLAVAIISEVTISDRQTWLAIAF